MGQEYSELNAEHIQFVEAQSMFFVATAPGGDSGRVNMSPKGLDSFRIIAPNQVAYLDITGSGNETAAHVTQNGRITLMFCSFGRAPMILRLYGGGRVVLPGTPEFKTLIPHFESLPGLRQLIVADLTSVKTSCGYGVPVMDLVKERNTLTGWASSEGEEALAEYRRKKNAVSLDGIPAPMPHADPR